VKILWSMVVVRGFSLCKHVNAGASVGEAGSWKLEAGALPGVTSVKGED
jgi:hypothetical protein